jgi:3-hydroxyacyl-[acyl-carrier-protein] dehydratase
MISSIEIREKLVGYPDEVIGHYESFRKDGDVRDLHEFVLGLICFMQDTDDSNGAQEVGDLSRLSEDLGIDSITIAEVIFLLEEIFEIEIQNQEVAQIATVGELREFILTKIS